MNYSWQILPPLEALWHKFVAEGRDPEQRSTMVNACFLVVHLTGAVRFLWIPVADVDITNVFDSHPLCPLQTEMESWARPKNVNISVGNWNCRNEFSAKPG